MAREVAQPLDVSQLLPFGHSAEQGEDSVASRLRDVTLVVVHGIDHELERRIDDTAGLFGIDALDQLHRTFDVGEERGDRLALAFEGAPRTEDFLREMVRGLRARRKS
jgi:hypothetical protein